MKDIDFDELDRAVSSVLGQSADTEKVTVQTNEKIKVESDKPSSPTQSPAAPVQELQPTAKKSIAAPRPASSPLAMKRRGKFMDVMHPSTDMAAAPAAQTPKIESPHVGTVLKPSTELKKEIADKDIVSDEEVFEPTATVDEGNALIGAEPAVAETVEEAAETGKVAQEDQPDNKHEVISNHSAADDDGSEDGEEVLATPASSLQDTVPHESPFLTDTKVEKRPLGGTPTGDEEEKDAPQPAPMAPLPPELQPDVVEVESAQEAQRPEPPEPGPFATHVKAGAEPRDGRVEGHPLFDTSTYHEPIAPVHKKSMPSWLKWLLGLLLCLAIGAGVGYFLFTAGL